MLGVGGSRRGGKDFYYEPSQVSERSSRRDQNNQSLSHYCALYTAHIKYSNDGAQEFPRCKKLLARDVNQLTYKKKKKKRYALTENDGGCTTQRGGDANH